VPKKSDVEVDIEKALIEALGLRDVDDVPAPTDTLETDTHCAAEYDGRILVVLYKADNYAAIWEGAE
jgi:hypothetical protein